MYKCIRICVDMMSVNGQITHNPSHHLWSLIQILSYECLNTEIHYHLCFNKMKLMTQFLKCNRPCIQGIFSLGQKDRPIVSTTMRKLRCIRSDHHSLSTMQAKVSMSKGALKKTYHPLPKSIQGSLRQWFTNLNLVSYQRSFHGVL